MGVSDNDKTHTHPLAHDQPATNRPANQQLPHYPVPTHLLSFLLPHLPTTCTIHCVLLSTLAYSLPACLFYLSYTHCHTHTRTHIPPLACSPRFATPPHSTPHRITPHHIVLYHIISRRVVLCRTAPPPGLVCWLVSRPAGWHWC